VDVEVVSRQVGDELAVFISDDGVEADDVYRDTETRRVCRSRLVGGAPSETRR
jgi:hypothetical protein